MKATQTDSLPQVAPPPSFESVWASLQEFSREMRESEEKAKRERRESDEKAKRETEELKRVVRAVSRQMGGLHRRFGELAEHLVAPGIHARFKEIGYFFDLVGTKGAKIYDENGKTKAEVDILLQNNDTIIAVEVKTRPAIKDVEHNIRRLEILRDSFRKMNDHRKIHGAIAGAVFGGDEKRAVIEAGMFVIEQSGDTMKIDIPDGFVPREF